MTLELAIVIGLVVSASLFVCILVLARELNRERARKPIVPPPAVSIDPNLLIDMATRIAECTATAMGNAMAAALAPAPITPQQEAMERVQHELEQLALDLDDPDDSDPTDALIPRDRTEATIVDANDPSPTGIPGLKFPTVDEFEPRGGAY